MGCLLRIFGENWFKNQPTLRLRFRLRGSRGIRSPAPSFLGDKSDKCSCSGLKHNNTEKLECGTWYHHPQRLQCVLSRNLRIFKVATWHYRCCHHLKNNCIWFAMLLIILQLNLNFQLNNNKATKCGIRRSWKMKVKPNHGCCSNIAVTTSYISVFVLSW